MSVTVMASKFAGNLIAQQLGAMGVKHSVKSVVAKLRTRQGDLPLNHTILRALQDAVVMSLQCFSYPLEFNKKNLSSSDQKWLKAFSKLLKADGTADDFLRSWYPDAEVEKLELNEYLPGHVMLPAHEERFHQVFLEWAGRKLEEVVPLSDLEKRVTEGFYFWSRKGDSEQSGLKITTFECFCQWYHEELKENQAFTNMYQALELEEIKDLLKGQVIKKADAREVWQGLLEESEEKIATEVKNVIREEMVPLSGQVAVVERSVGLLIFEMARTQSAIADLEPMLAGLRGSVVKGFQQSEELAAQRHAEVMEVIARRKSLNLDQPASLESAPDLYLEREEVQEAIVEAWRGGKHTFVYGRAGIGKSTATHAALHDERAVQHFAKRFYVRCKNATSVESLKAEIGKALGTSRQAKPFEDAVSVLASLKESQLLVFDNFETPWDSPLEEAEVKSVLNEIIAISGVVVSLSFRGEDRVVDGAHWVEIPIPPLDQEAHALFRCRAGLSSDFESAELDHLIEASSGIPLVIETMARSLSRNAGARDVMVLWKRWQEQRTKSQDVLHCAFELSWDSERLDESARTSLRLIALLPGGLSLEDLEGYLGETGWEDSTQLRQRLLLEQDHLERLSLLPPIREWVLGKHPVSPEEGEKALFCYLQLFEECCDGESSPERNARLGPELGNLEGLFLQFAVGLKDEEIKKFAGKVLIHTPFLMRLSGFWHPKLLKAGARIFPDWKQTANAAQCIEGLGDIALRKGDNEQAAAKFGEALVFFEKAGSPLGQGNCAQGLGDIALSKLEFGQAGQQFEQAVKYGSKGGNFFNVGVVGLSSFVVDLWREEGDSEMVRELAKCSGQHAKQLAVVMDSMRNHQGTCLKAQETLRQAVEIFKQYGNASGERYALYRLALVSEGEEREVALKAAKD